jgi:hypothetical protein
VDVSRKDYRAVAQTLKELRSTSPIPEGWDEIIEKLCRVFKQDNPRFSEQKFWDYIEQ